MGSTAIDNWLFMSSILIPSLISAVSVVILALIIRNRWTIWQPPTGEKIMIGCMLLLGVLHTFLFVSLFISAFRLNYGFLRCNGAAPLIRPSDRSSTLFRKMSGLWNPSISEEEERIFRIEMGQAQVLWIYLVVKMMELLEQPLYLLGNPTFFQVSYTFSIHHVIMVLTSWVGLKTAPGGSTVIWVVISSGFLAVAYLEEFRRRAWVAWYGVQIVNRETTATAKLYMKRAKIAHFVLAILHSIFVLATTEACNYPSFHAVFILVFTVILLVVYW